METMVSRALSERESGSWSKFSGDPITALVYECALDDVNSVSYGDGAWSGAAHFRRASFVVDVYSSGAVYVAEMSKDQADAQIERARAEHDAEMESLAWQAHPDTWRARGPESGELGDAETYADEADARSELAKVIRRLRKRSDVDVWRTDSASFECRAAEDCGMEDTSVTGVYWIEHTDNSDAREDYLCAW